MHVIFDDPQFDFQTLRLLGSAATGDAEVGEVLSTAARITPGDFASWTAQWLATARRVHGVADECKERGHLVSAREAYLRAANYYRAAEFYLHGDPADPGNPPPVPRGPVVFPYGPGPEPGRCHRPRDSLREHGAARLLLPGGRGGAARGHADRALRVRRHSGGTAGDRHGGQRPGHALRDVRGPGPGGRHPGRGPALPPGLGGGRHAGARPRADAARGGPGPHRAARAQLRRLPGAPGGGVRAPAGRLHRQRRRLRLHGEQPAARHDQAGRCRLGPRAAAGGRAGDA